MMLFFSEKISNSETVFVLFGPAASTNNPDFLNNVRGI